MRIVKLEAENFKRLKAVSITPDGDTIIISGKNAQGKSSVLDAIWSALAGKSGAVDRPIRDGQDHAEVTVTLDNLVVTRTWTEGKTSSLVVKSPEGARFNSPQAMLDSLIGQLSFDPLAFANADAKSQVKTLLALVDLPFDPADLASQRQAAYDSRTDVQRRRKQVEGAISELPSIPSDTPDDEIDVVNLAGQVQNATQMNERNAARKAALLREHAENKEAIATLRNSLATLEARQAEIVAEGKDIPVEADLSLIVNQMETAETVNKAVRVKRNRDELRGLVQELKTTADAFTREIADVDTRKAAGLAAAEFPIEGLGFDEEGVTYNGVPFSQASGAERLRVSVAMAMAMNPTLRVIRISDGSLLDSDNMALLDSMASDKDFQVWVERVEDGGDIGVVIEDGSVKNG